LTKKKDEILFDQESQSEKNFKENELDLHKITDMLINQEGTATKYY